MVLIITALRRIGRGITSSVFEFGFAIYLFSWDVSLTLINTLTFKRKIGRVTPKGTAGEGGIWPEYTPPQPGDSRCSCPALNALANHGSSVPL
jgi:Peroxidase, family 2